MYAHVLGIRSFFFCLSWLCLISGCTGRFSSENREFICTPGQERIADDGRERCVCEKTSKELAVVDKKYFRPSDVTYLRGDYSKIKNDFGWEPTTSFEEMTEKMIKSDIDLLKSGNTHIF